MIYLLQQSFLNFFLIGIFLISPSLSFPQSIDVDSIINSIYKTKSDSIKVEKILNFISNNKHKNPKQIEYFLKQSISIGLENKHSKALMICYSELGTIYFNGNNFNGAKLCYEKALVIAKEKKDLINEAYILISLARVYTGIHESDKAIELYAEANKIFDKTKDSTLFNYINSELIVFYMEQNNYNEVEKIGRKSYLYYSKNKDWYNLYFLLNNLALNAYYMNDYTKSEKYYKECFQLATETLKDSINTAETYINYSYLLRDQKKFNESLICLNIPLSLAKKSKDTCMLFYSYAGMGNIHYFLNNYNVSNLYLDSSLNYSGNDCHNKLNYLADVYNYYSKNYEKLGDYSRALLYHKKYAQYADSSNAIIFNDKLVAFQMQFETKKKEDEIIILNADKKSLNAEKKLQLVEIKLRNFVIIIFIISALVAVVLYNRYKIRQKLTRENEIIKAEKKNMELQQKLLLSQMPTHFISNSFQAIKMFLIKEDPAKISDYLSDYARLSRLVLQASQSNYINLKEEIELLTSYLKLEQLKLNHSFNYTIHLSDNISNELEEISIPSMILQPMIENAILHGIKPLQDKKGEIKMEVETKNENTLKITIEDNGVGRQQASEKKSDSHQSFSSINIENRLKILSEEFEHKIKYEIQDLYSKENISTGTKIMLEIPI